MEMLQRKSQTADYQWLKRNSYKKKLHHSCSMQSCIQFFFTVLSTKEKKRLFIMTDYSISKLLKLIFFFKFCFIFSPVAHFTIKCLSLRMNGNESWFDFLSRKIILLYFTFFTLKLAWYNQKKRQNQFVKNVKTKC